MEKDIRKETVKEIADWLEDKTCISYADMEKFRKKFMKQPKVAGELKVGDRFIYGGIEWVKLDDSFGASLVLAVNPQADAAFDKNGSNNWATSSLRKDINAYENEHFRWAVLKDVNKEDLIEFTRDLTPDDGMTEYGTCKDFISIYSCDEYRRYRKLIPDCVARHWTITGDSLVYSRGVRYVLSDGSLGSIAADFNNYGVRPLCVLKYPTEVEAND